MVEAILAFMQLARNIEHMSAVAAAQKAAYYQYFRDLSDQQINELVFALANQYPEYKYWEWYDIIVTLRKYGALPEKEEKAPEPQPEPKNQTMIWVAVGIAVAVIVFGGMRK